MSVSGHAIMGTGLKDMEEIWTSVLLDAQESPWDTPNWLLVGNLETGQAVMVEYVDMKNLDHLVKSVSSLLHQVDYVVTYAEGYGVIANSMSEAMYRKGDKDEMKIVIMVGKDFARNTFLFRSKEEEGWAQSSGPEHIYTTESNIGEQLINIRKEMDW